MYLLGGGFIAAGAYFLAARRQRRPGQLLAGYGFLSDDGRPDSLLSPSQSLA